MKYLGGKVKLANYIANQIADLTTCRDIWEPFCGGCSVTQALVSRDFRVHASDIHPALISLYQACQAGWRPPETVTEEQYRQAKNLPDSDPLKAFCGFPCSFGGKWFGGYARGGGRDHQNEAYRNVCKMFPLSGVTYECTSFLTSPRQSDLIYCDPPYAGTTGYRDSMDHAAFWKKCQEHAARGAAVLVSEFTCPVPAEVVWEKQRRTVVSGNCTKTETEKLFLVL